MAYRVKYTAMKVIKWTIKLPQIRGLQSCEPHLIMSFGLLMWEHWARERERETGWGRRKETPLVLITASFLSLKLPGPAGVIAGIPAPLPTYTQTSRPPAPGPHRRPKLIHWPESGSREQLGQSEKRQYGRKKMTAKRRMQRQTHLRKHAHLTPSQSMQRVLFKAWGPQTGKIGVSQ